MKNPTEGPFPPLKTTYKRRTRFGNPEGGDGSIETRWETALTHEGEADEAEQTRLRRLREQDTLERNELHAGLRLRSAGEELRALETSIRSTPLGPEPETKFGHCHTSEEVGRKISEVEAELKRIEQREERSFFAPLTRGIFKGTTAAEKRLGKDLVDLRTRSAYLLQKEALADQAARLRTLKDRRDYAGDDYTIADQHLRRGPRW